MSPEITRVRKSSASALKSGGCAWRVLALILFSASLAAQPQGPPPLPDEVAQKFAEHKKWVDSDGLRGERAILVNETFLDLDLTERDLSKMLLLRVDFSGARMHQTDFREAILYQCKLNNVFAEHADFRGAFVQGTEFIGANLTAANFEGADLTGAVLTRALLNETNLKNAVLAYADCTQAIFLPRELPDARDIATAKGLETLQFRREPSASFDLQPIAGVQLRDAFKKAGFRRQEREVTYALNRIEHLTGEDELFRYIFFEWTCNWGMTPKRPLKLMVYLGALCWLFYATVLFCAPLQQDPQTGRGIYRKWEDTAKGREYLSRLQCNPLITGFAFSLTSAFYIGLEELRLENWLARLNPLEYKLRSNGWVRTVSAVQAIFTAYLFALWILTYFGRPFE